MVRTDRPQHHRSAERTRCDIAGIKRAVIQHDAQTARVVATKAVVIKTRFILRSFLDCTNHSTTIWPVILG